MLLQLPASEADDGRARGQACVALDAAAEPFAEDHPHVEAWALHLAAEACLAAGHPELTVVAMAQALAEHECERCRVEFLRLGAVKGHLVLPIGGQRNCPVVAIRTAQRRP